MIKKIAFFGILASQLSTLTLASVPIPKCYPCLVGPATTVAASSVKSVPIPKCYPCAVNPTPAR